MSPLGWTLVFRSLAVVITNVLLRIGIDAEPLSARKGSGLYLVSTV